MLQQNAVTGALFLIGILYNSWIMAIGALIGVFSSTVAAIILRYETKDIHKGLYGFNGVLLGVTLFYFFEINTLLFFLTIIGSVLSSFIMHFMHKKNLYPYTFPFILSSWIILFIVNTFELIPLQKYELLSTLDFNLFSSVILGFGQVMFQENIITGLIFLIGILISSRLSAFYALFGSFIGSIFAIILSFDIGLISLGIFSFNAVLCGLAFADNKKISLVYAASSVILSVFILSVMNSYNLTTLTFPFILATWLMIFIQKNRS